MGTKFFDIHMHKSDKTLKTRTNLNLKFTLCTLKNTKTLEFHQFSKIDILK